VRIPVVAHATQALEVIDGGPDHAGHCRDGFEHDGAMAVALGEERIRAESKQLRKPEGDAV